MLRVLVSLVFVAFWVYSVVDSLQAAGDDVSALPKPAWVTLCVILPPFGGLAWFLLGRPGAPWGSDPSTPYRRPIGPDDDPDFLRRL